MKKKMSSRHPEYFLGWSTDEGDRDLVLSGSYMCQDRADFPATPPAVPSAQLTRPSPPRPRVPATLRARISHHFLRGALLDHSHLVQTLPPTFKLKYLYFKVVWNLQKSCKDSTENSSTPLPQFPPNANTLFNQNVHHHQETN